MSTRTHETRSPPIPTSRRSASPESSTPRPTKVFRAFTDQELFARWVGPRSIDTRIEQWDAATGGNYRYAAGRDGEEIATFYGSFHEVRPTSASSRPSPGRARPTVSASRR